MKKAVIISIGKSIGVVLLCLNFNIGLSQNVVVTDDDAYTAHSSAMLDVKSLTKGMLIPRLTQTQRDAISSPADGLLIFQTDNATGIYYYQGSWKMLGAASGDNLGNHIATQNIKLNTNWLSNDGDNEGVFIDASGNVGIGTSSPVNKLSVMDTTDGGYAAIGLGISGGTRLPYVRLYMDDELQDAGSWGLKYSWSALGGQPFRIISGGNTQFTIIRGGNVGIGTTSPASQLHIGGIVAVGDGNINRLALHTYHWDSGPWLFNTRAIGGSEYLDFKYNTTNVMTMHFTGRTGIGTNAPVELFQIGDGTGSDYALLHTSVSTAYSGGLLITNADNSDAGSTSFKLSSSYNGTGATSGTMKMGFVNNADKEIFQNGGASILIQNGTGNVTLAEGSGNVGIGNISPLAKFHVFGDAIFGNSAYNWNTSDGVLELAIRQPWHFGQLGTGGSAQLTLHPSVDGTGFYIQSADQGWDYAFGVIPKNVNSESSIIMLPDGGNVGIGTTTPGSTLDVYGTANANAFTWTNGGVNTYNLTVGRTGTTSKTHPYYMYIRRSRDGSGILYNNDVVGRIYFQGHTGVAYQTLVNIQADVDGTASSTSMPGRLIFATTPNGTIMPVERMRITNAGNVGIGTTIPTARLEVKADPSSTVDDILFSVKDKAGNNVFIVYPESVEVIVPETTKDGDKANKRGAFVVSGRGTKGEVNFMDMTKENYLIGHDVASGITTGTKNSIFGYEAGNLLTTGFSNVFLGYTAGLRTNGNYNVFVGSGAGQWKTSGNNNILIGYGAGGGSVGTMTTLGNDNIFIGTRAGSSSGTSSIDNVYIGIEAGYSNSSGTSSVYIGQESGYWSTNGASNVYVGFYSGNSNTSGDYNTYVGMYAGGQGSTGYNNTYLGASAGEYATGHDNVFIGHNAGSGETGHYKLYIDNSATTLPLIWGDFNINVVRINGHLQYTGTLSQVSDKRFKKNITKLERPIDKLSQINGFNFYWKTNEYPEMIFSDEKQIGVIAQAVEKVFPELVVTDEDGYKAVDYVKFTPILIEAIKDQQKQIDAKDKEIKELNERLKAVEKYIQEQSNLGMK